MWDFLKRLYILHLHMEVLQSLKFFRTEVGEFKFYLKNFFCSIVEYFGEIREGDIMANINFYLTYDSYLWIRN